MRLATRRVRRYLSPPNGLPLSRAAPLDRDAVLAGSDTQNGPDLAAAQRRRLDGRVGREGGGSASPTTYILCINYHAHLQQSAGLLLGQ